MPASEQDRAVAQVNSEQLWSPPHLQMHLSPASFPLGSWVKARFMQDVIAYRQMRVLEALLATLLPRSFEFLGR